MLVVFELNGKQYDGLLGRELKVDLLETSGAALSIDKVLLFKKSDEDVLIGKPYVEGAKLNAAVKGMVKDKKVLVFQYRRRKDSKKMSGHRQQYTVLRLDSLVCQGQEFKAPVEAPAVKAEPAVTPAVKKAPAKVKAKAKA